MSEIIAKTEPKGFEQVPPGTHKARCIKVIDLGTQRNEWDGIVTWKEQVLVIWELPELLRNGIPQTISKFYNLSLHEKANLRIDLVSWRGREFTAEEKQAFDIAKLVGVPCQLNVIDRNGKTKVDRVFSYNGELDDQFHESTVFTISDYKNGNTEIYADLSDGIKRIIDNSKEMETANTDLGDDNNGADIGDVPF